ncbi:Alpha/Beta hydrolase protein [Fusarium redolens]|uniref:Alpha/Beta hydrolase protein n=1 Tax=Fusarium redolens TaxID=48865 RepID=A0A9P9KIF4_FUSRE|nr:Alpha/Beta hydrolase protein [Fusarium redolens]KAH7253724.1 Alpha/Beta hydrolase protein [Fusarium redolens]
MPSTQKPVILLVHGAWHGSWAWKYQVPELESLGYTTQTLDLPSVSGAPGKTQADDAAHVRSVLEPLLAEGKQVVVLAHSYGGPIGCGAITGLSLTERARNDLTGGVLGFINLCGYIFPGGMDQGAVIRSLGGLPYVDWDTPSPGLFVAKDPGSLLYRPDVSKDHAEWALSQLQPQSMAANMGIVPPQAWQEGAYKGRLAYIKATEDAVIPFSDQESMIAASGGSEAWITRVLEGSGHSPQISRPGEVAQVVESLIRDFQP